VKKKEVYSERQIGVKSACEFKNKIENKIRLDYRWNECGWVIYIVYSCRSCSLLSLAVMDRTCPQAAIRNR